MGSHNAEQQDQLVQEPSTEGASDFFHQLHDVINISLHGVLLQLNGKTRQKCLDQTIEVSYQTVRTGTDTTQAEPYL